MKLTALITAIAIAASPIPALAQSSMTPGARNLGFTLDSSNTSRPMARQSSGGSGNNAGYKSPERNDTYTAKKNGVTYRYTGSKWTPVSTPNTDALRDKLAKERTAKKRQALSDGLNETAKSVGQASNKSKKSKKAKKSKAR